VKKEEGSSRRMSSDLATITSKHFGGNQKGRDLQKALNIQGKEGAKAPEGVSVKDR